MQRGNRALWGHIADSGRISPQLLLYAPTALLLLACNHLGPSQCEAESSSQRGAESWSQCGELEREAALCGLRGGVHRMLLQQLFGLGFQVGRDREIGFRVQLQLHTHSSYTVTVLQLHTHSAAVTQSQQLQSHSAVNREAHQQRQRHSRGSYRGTDTGTDTGIGQVIQRALNSEGAVLHGHR